MNGLTLQWDVAKIVRSSIKKSCVSVFTTRKHALQCICNYRRAVTGVVSTEPWQARAEHQPVRRVADTTALIMECSKNKAAVAAPLLYTCLTKKRKRGGGEKRHSGRLPPLGRDPLLSSTLCRCHEHLFSRDCRSAATQHNRPPECGRHSFGALQPADVFLLFP